jgi:2-aminoadipate transaminase
VDDDPGVGIVSVSISDLYSDRVKAAPAPYFPRPPGPIVYDFYAGDPPPETYPLEELKEYLVRAMDRAGIQLTQYNPTWRQDMVRGDPGLRERLAERISRRDGRDVDADWIMLAHGSSDGLALAARAFLSPGDGAIVEAATFPYMVGYMRATGAQIATVPVDRDGMVVDAIEDRLRRLRDSGVRPKMIYVIPTFHVPTGALMPIERREKLVALAQKWGVMVVEDNAYYEQYFDEPPPPTLFSMDDSGLVLLSETFGKQLAPGLRLGYMTGVPEAMQALDLVREDLGVNKLIPMMLDEYIGDGKLDAHMERVRAASRQKRDAALAALQKHCEPWVEFEVPRGGIYFWLKLSDEIDPEKLTELLNAGGIACRAGEGFSDDGSAGAGCLRMSFQQETLEGIERGVESLGRALAASTTRP